MLPAALVVACRGTDPPTPIRTLRLAAECPEPGDPAPSAELRELLEQEPVPTRSALVRAVDLLVHPDLSEDRESASAAIAAILAKWAPHGDWRITLDELYLGSATGDLSARDVSRQSALCLIARAWLALAFARGSYPAWPAEDWVYGLVRELGRDPSHGPSSNRVLLGRLVGWTLVQQDARREAPQLYGVPRLGDEILGALPPGGAARETLLDLLASWCRVQGEAARELLAGLRRAEDHDLRAVGYHVAFWIDPGAVADLRSHLIQEQSPVMAAVLLQMAAHPERIELRTIWEVVRRLAPEQRHTLPLAALGLELVQARSTNLAPLLELFRSLARDSSTAALDMRRTVLAGFVLARPEPLLVRTVYAASFDPQIRIAALSALAVLEPQLALNRHWDLLTSPALEDRLAALASLPNLLHHAPRRDAKALITLLSRLLEDPRIAADRRADVVGLIRELRDPAPVDG